MRIKNCFTLLAVGKPGFIAVKTGFASSSPFAANGWGSHCLSLVGGDLEVAMQALKAADVHVEVLR